MLLHALLTTYLPISLETKWSKSNQLFDLFISFLFPSFMYSLEKLSFRDFFHQNAS
jgi:hypothetical protein